MKISIGSDHAGFELKEVIINYLKSNHEILDKGCFDKERVDYSDFGHKVANSVVLNETTIGILLCGSGNGIAMSANKHAGIRAAICWNKEICKLARQHNDANILVLPARFVTSSEAIEMIDIFLSESFEGGRHLERIKKINIL